MDVPGDSPQARSQADTVRPARDAFSERFAAVVQPAGEEPLDLATYLINPPPSAEEAARADRRRRHVRTASLAAAALLAVVLLAPLPGGGDAEPTLPEAVAAPDAGADQFPQRVDTPMPAASPRRAAATKPAPLRRSGGASRPREVTAAVRRPAASGSGRLPARPRATAPVTTTKPVTAPVRPSGQQASSSAATSGGGTAVTTAPANPSVAPAGATTSTDAPTEQEGVGTSR